MAFGFARQNREHSNINITGHRLIWAMTECRCTPVSTNRCACRVLYDVNALWVVYINVTGTEIPDGSAQPLLGQCAAAS